ncbi:ABC transporter ATP-binding protein [Clostridium gasigenes]|uniref:ABC transporter ATP-binding protein n=1 Tax=Clostridium gasigenes TaxID=94869 RepID=UPI001C0BC54F|nr:ATP-binding cassette domain-containing protein [Clostridium gasigenes]MBU3106434.1 ATP-binding cassette domain-containing protein [Clostridium gasigenes]
MALTVTNLNKNYGENKVVDNLSFSIDKPGVFGLLGTNGAGKTTTIRMILGMINKDGGTVTWNGEKYTPNTVSTGYLAEERGIYAKFSIIDQLIYFGELKGMSKADAIKSINYWLERLEATEYKNKKADQLSKGNQQKIQFVAALISNPSLLILDEPLSGLDPVNTDLFKEVIKEQISKGKYIIMSSHQMNTIEEFCENLLILNKGKTILQGNLKEIKKGYGRNRLLVKCDEDIKHLIKECNMEIESENAEEINLMVKSQEEVNRLLKRITDENISLVKFELREPSLHEIFIEKVGGQ